MKNSVKYMYETRSITVFSYLMLFIIFHRKQYRNFIIVFCMRLGLNPCTSKLGFSEDFRPSLRLVTVFGSCKNKSFRNENSHYNMCTVSNQLTKLNHNIHVSPLKSQNWSKIFEYSKWQGFIHKICLPFA